MIDLKQDIQYIKKVGPARAKLLNKLGIFTLEDLITYFPREYEDRSNPKLISELVPNEEALFRGTVTSKMSELRIRKNLVISKLIVRDSTGSIVITWYNQKYLKDRFVPGKTYKFFGKITAKYGNLEMNSPAFDEDEETKNTGKIIPMYPLTYALSQNVIRSIIQSGLDIVNNKLEEFIPNSLAEKYKLCEINRAINLIHFPENLDTFEEARRRLVFEELLLLQLALLSLKNEHLEDKEGIVFDKNVNTLDIISSLSFNLTKAQLRVLEEIESDMEGHKPMNRLLQGDVGSGKTIISIVAAYKAVKSGYQVSVMVPTGILANQHLISYKEILEKHGIVTEVLTSNITKKNKEIILNKLKSKEIDVLIGTHAVIEDNVEFNNLGLVITDEQHRFGVRQRGKLTNKGKNPDVLVMTATPIPRTLALILYGDLDISIIDELPPNRKVIETYAITKDKEERLNNFVKNLLDEGRQAYIVCPLVEESENIEAKSVLEVYEKYTKEAFSNYWVAYLHGKMKPKEKDAIMQDFKDGKTQLLISTTVIEVGINVPNACIMIIENAERFGLAALHQLRGRVGRGEDKSYCILKYEGRSDIVKQRMQVMTSTNDGFVISEKDLSLRGPGEFFGTRQHGLPELKIADLSKDVKVLKAIQEISIELLQKDPKLEQEENIKLKQKLMEKYEQNIEL